jgi:hypothetical protein
MVTRNNFHNSNVKMFMIIRPIQSWYKHAMCLHVLHVSAYCGHHQVHRAFTITLLSAIPPYTGQRLYTGSAFYRYVFYVMPVC